jgi:hypothetical protein
LDPGAPASGVSTVTVHIDLPPSGVSTNGNSANLPALINNTNGNIVRPIGITIGGEAASWNNGNLTVNGVTTSAARVDERGAPDRPSVVAEFNLSTSNLIS